jgi:hypothetical protein
MIIPDFSSNMVIASFLLTICKVDFISRSI